MKAILRHIRISPKKMNLVAGLVRSKPVDEALALLKFIPKKAAPLLYKVVKSATSNAVTNFKQKEQDLVIEEILVSKGSTLKRFVPVSKGRAHPIRKFTSHVTVKLNIKKPDKTAKAVTEVAVKKAPKSKK